LFSLSISASGCTARRLRVWTSEVPDFRQLTVKPRQKRISKGIFHGSDLLPPRVTSRVSLYLFTAVDLDLPSPSTAHRSLSLSHASSPSTAAVTALVRAFGRRTPSGCDLPRSCVPKIKKGRRSGDREILLVDHYCLEEGNREEGRVLHLLHPALLLAASKDSASEAGDQVIAHQT
jgi:hypothetical protein